MAVRIGNDFQRNVDSNYLRKLRDAVHPLPISTSDDENAMARGQGERLWVELASTARFGVQRAPYRREFPTIPWWRWTLCRRGSGRRDVCALAQHAQMGPVLVV